MSARCFQLCVGILLVAACSSAATKVALPADASVDAAAPSREGGEAIDATTTTIDASRDAPETGTVIADAGDGGRDAASSNPYVRSLVGYWPLDGNGQDLSGGGRPLALVGSPAFMAGAFGGGLALVGNGSQYATRGISDPEFEFGASDFTISVWVQFNAAAPEQTLVEKFDGQMGPGFSFVKLGTGEAHFWSHPSALVTSAPLALASKMWHHFVARRMATAFALFVDGANVATATSAVAIPSTGMPLLLGRRNANDGRAMALDGTLDDLAIWSRALDDSEIRGLWRSGTGRAVLP